MKVASAYFGCVKGAMYEEIECHHEKGDVFQAKGQTHRGGLGK
jgi:hypothetical protein